MSKELVEKKNALITRAEEVLGIAKAESRELTEAEKNELVGMRDQVRSIDETLEIEDSFREMGNMTKKNDATPTEEVIKVEKETMNRSVEEMERKAFENYIRGTLNERGEDVNMTKGDNGAVIPTTIANMIIKKVYDICPLLERSQRFNVKGTLSIPFYPANAAVNITAAYQNEFSAIESTSGSFSSISLTGFLAGALTKISRSLINNAQFDIVSFVVDEMAFQIKRFIEKELISGTASKVDGLSKLSNGIVAASASAITAEEIVQLHDKIKDEYQGDAVWIMSPATRTALRTLKSGTGYFLLNDDISTPFGTSLLGKPVYVSDNMADIGDGEPVIFYGDFTGLATKFNEEINVQVLREKYADEHAVGVIAWFEFDAKVINEQKIAKLVMSGTSL